MRTRTLARASSRRSDTGGSLVEVVIAAAVLGLGLVGVVAGLVHAMGGLEAGRQQTAATFLAEQRMEQLKAGALDDFSNVTAARYPAEGYGTISSDGATMPGYRRTVSIVEAPGGLADTKLVEVSVFYRPLVGFGVLAAEREIRVSALLAARQ